MGQQQNFHCRTIISILWLVKCLRNWSWPLESTGPRIVQWQEATVKSYKAILCYCRQLYCIIYSINILARGLPFFFCTMLLPSAVLYIFHKHFCKGFTIFLLYQGCSSWSRANPATRSSTEKHPMDIWWVNCHLQTLKWNLWKYQPRISIYKERTYTEHRIITILLAM